MINDDNVITDSTARLTSVFKGKVRIEGLLRAFLTGHQNVENALQVMLEDRALLTAYGAQLDIIGEIVGQPREGRGDEEYLTYIIAKIGQNISKGTATEVITIFNLLTGSANPLLIELGNATIEIYSDVDISGLDSDSIYTFMGLVVSAGVKIGAIGHTNGEEDYFGWEADPDSSGFASLEDDTGAGEWTSII